MKTPASPSLPMALPAAIQMAPEASAWQCTQLEREAVLRNVGAAALLPVLPPVGRGNGRAVLVVPGGGFLFVAVDNEGLPVAQRLAEAGYAAFVLVYRTQPTDVDDRAFQRALPLAWQRLAEQVAADGDLAAHGPAVDDTRTAMRWLRTHAADFAFDPARLGVLGFSAGARCGRALVAQAAPADMPDSLALIYGGFAGTVPRSPVPPLFLAQAADDPLFDRRHPDILDDWRRAGQRAELHLYERGGHGFGLRTQDATSDHWFDAYRAWLDRQ
ncbi:alpha/beta hydrolase fold domain-containing protein [Aquincola sp. S2]|uniref:Alpha/beta hydrolase fold domain-containing protein n=1 Tax=Pseudaquabacterium terrae TaxID=2732868 RepID=A0ABX2ESR1_9BURK|nr:alpha/beta hydrolase fold domain-containing protein [Aquabacterium terrae]NRF71668.1 alpha/beta hydrolase fold domain-containing protein [Aquabacterium terrae]